MLFTFVFGNFACISSIKEIAQIIDADLMRVWYSSKADILVAV